MAAARSEHGAVRLPDGRVLVAAGFATSTILDSSEVYDPSSGSWSPAGSLSTARDVPSMTLLGDGTVLVAGGRDPNGNVLNSTEVYHPGTNA
jgi:hypothetical protein